MKKVTLKTLTNEEYRVLNKIAYQTNMDCWFYIHQKRNGEDVVKDLENHRYLSLRSGVYQMNEGIVPELLELSDNEWNTYNNILKQLNLIKRECK